MTSAHKKGTKVIDMKGIKSVQIIQATERGTWLTCVNASGDLLPTRNYMGQKLAT